MSVRKTFAALLLTTTLTACGEGEKPNEVEEVQVVEEPRELTFEDVDLMSFTVSSRLTRPFFINS